MLHKVQDISLLLIKADLILRECYQWLKSPWPMVTESGVRTSAQNPCLYFAWRFERATSCTWGDHHLNVYPVDNFIIFIRIKKNYNLLVILFWKKFYIWMCTQPWHPQCNKLLVFHLCSVNKPNYEYIEQIIWLA